MGGVGGGGGGGGGMGEMSEHFSIDKHMALS